MAFRPAPGEQYTIRRKILTLFGASFHVFDDQGAMIAFCRQKAFKLREDIRVYKDESREHELFTIKARSILDFGASYDVRLPEGTMIGSLRRRGLKSFVRDSWLLFDDSGEQFGTMEEDSTGMALARRFLPMVALISPQSFRLVRGDGTALATLRTHFNPFVYRLGIAIHESDERADDLLILAAGCLIAAVEGRQDSGGDSVLDAVLGG